MAEDSEVIWRIVMEDNAEIEKQMCSDWKCTICSKMLINAHSGPCGCRYCRRCIANHLQGSNKFCPGDSEDCRGQELCLDRNVLIDQAVNMRISNTTVKCPEELCSFQSELRRMHDHLRLCGKVSDKCPYCQIGCSMTSIVRDKINEHLQVENHSHSKLLFQWINNLNNDVGAMRRDHQCLREEVSSKMNRKEDMIIELDRTNGEHTLNINLLEARLQRVEADSIEAIIGVNAIKVENQSLKQKIDGNQVQLIEVEWKNIEFEHKFHNVEEELIGAVNRDIDKIKGAGEEMSLIMDNKQVKIAELETRNTELEERLKQLEERQNKMKPYFPKSVVILSVIINIYLFFWMIMEITHHEQVLESLHPRLDYLEIEKTKYEAKYGEFEWKIERFSEKKKDAEKRIVFYIFSEPFFTHENGYLICLCVFPNGDRSAYGHHLSIYFNIMKGPYDNLLPWPMEHHVIIELINQDSGQAFLTGTAYSNNSSLVPELQKPKFKRNNGFGYSEFISFETLLKNQGLIKNDAILIKCKIKLIN